jgi:AcrR family transcriptional regulator
MSRQRQTKSKEEIRNLILSTAKEIMMKEGVDKISIRKITNALDYSPGIVYHYFKNKEDIIETLLRQGYEEILLSLKKVENYNLEPERELKERVISYIDAVLRFSDSYLAIMLSHKTSVLKYTSMLKEGVSEDRKSIRMLCDTISRGIQLDKFKDCNVELTAQVMWASIFGLTVRLIIEGDIEIDQRNRLIDEQLDILISGIKKR